MSLEVKLALAALIVAVVAVPIAAWVTRQYGTRRRRLLFVFEATSLVPPINSKGAASLKVTFDDAPVKEPHLLTIRLENIGPSDVSSAHFDSGRPIQIKLNSWLVGYLSNTHDEDTITYASLRANNNSTIGLQPVLLARKEAWVIELLVSGNPAPQLTSSLIDTDVVFETAGDRIIVATSRALGGSIALGLPTFGVPRVAAGAIVDRWKSTRRK